MASPGDKKGQRKGSCGHIMVAFDLHDKCARCRDKRIGEDNCVLDKPCPICDGFSDTQRELLATPSYRIRKDIKAGLLVSPKDVTVIKNMKPAVLLRDLDRVLLSALAGEAPTDIALMSVGIKRPLPLPLIKHLSNSSRGDSSVGVGLEDVGGF